MERKYMYGICVVLALALFATPVGATILTYLGNMLTGMFTVQSPITNAWNATAFTGITNATVIGNSVMGNITSGNPVSLSGTIDNNAPASSRNLTFTFASQYANLTSNNLTSADIPITSLTIDGTPAIATCTVIGADYSCAANGIILSNGHHLFAFGYTTSPFFDTTSNLAVGMKVQ